MSSVLTKQQLEMVEELANRIEKENTIVFEKDDPTLNDITLKVRSYLVRHKQIIVHYNENKSVKLYKVGGENATSNSPKKANNPASKPVIKATHEYIMPHFTEEVLALLSCAKDWKNQKSTNIRLVGPHGSGKTEFVRHIADMAGFAEVGQINGHADMDSSHFLGEKTVVVDEKSMQNYIKYQIGTLENAMTCGLEKDENGHIVLDDNGNVKVTGAPAILFIDEYAAIPETVSIVLNRALEIPKAPGESRQIEITTDGGRVVKSHPGFCIMLSGNTLGRGISGDNEQGYTAQDIQQDASTLDRISATYRFGYNLRAEKQIMMGKIGDDTIVRKLVEFRDNMRKSRQNETVETLISTRMIVKLCDNIRVFKEAKLKDPVGRGIYRTIFSSLTETEKQAWNESVNMTFGVNILNTYETKNNDMWMF